MFENLKNRITSALGNFKGRKKINEYMLDKAMREIRVGLIEADVPLEVARNFIDNVKEEAIGKNIIKNVNPADMITKIVYDQLVKILSIKDVDKQGRESEGLNLRTNPPAKIMMVGLNGSGKTTNSAKLALFLKEEMNKNILLVSLDNTRAGAKKQLEILAESVNIDSLPIIEGEKPFDIANRSFEESKHKNYDVIIYDSAGRMHVDEELLDEIDGLKRLIDPVETILVIDSLLGQDSLKIVNSFHDRLNITSAILSRIDADSRGGVALSLSFMTNIAIKFLSNGEKIGDFEKFNPERIASRILDKGDIVSLVEKASKIVNEEETEKMAKKLKKGKFDLNDYIKQIDNLGKLGGMSYLLKMLPGNIAQKAKKITDDQGLLKHKALYNSMTKKERTYPEIITANRKKRIANGSGLKINDLNQFLKQFTKMQQMAKKMLNMPNMNDMNMDMNVDQNDEQMNNMDPKKMLENMQNMANDKNPSMSGNFSKFKNDFSKFFKK